MESQEATDQGHYVCPKCKGKFSEPLDHALEEGLVCGTCFDLYSTFTQQVDQLEADLCTILTKRFGTNWRRDLKLRVRADNLYWLVFLAAKGILAKREEYKKNGSERVEMAASLADWHLTLESLVDQAETAPALGHH